MVFNPELSSEMHEIVKNMAEKSGKSTDEVLGRMATLASLLDQEKPASERE